LLSDSRGSTVPAVISSTIPPPAVKAAGFFCNFNVHLVSKFRRITAGKQPVRRSCLWISRGRTADVRGTHTCRIHASTSRCADEAVSWVGDPECPFANLPESKEGRWGQGLTAAKMRECRWLRPVLIGEFVWNGRRINISGIRDLCGCGKNEPADGEDLTPDVFIEQNAHRLGFQHLASA
jgi:hypothetical protein